MTTVTIYPAGLKALLAGLIDYAGLFPPASLPLDEAVGLYGRYQTEPESWMLSRFIIPAARLSQLSPGAGPMPLSVLGRGGEIEADFLDGLEADLTAVTAVTAVTAALNQHDQLTADVFEVKLPALLFSQPDTAVIARFITKVVARITAVRPMTPFFEMPLPPTHPGWRAGVLALIESLALVRQGEGERGRGGEAPGFKLRCGGVEAAAFPSVEQIALAVDGCWRAAVPLKATAGLHHPIRHFNDTVQTKMHGFLNLFGGGILAAVNDLSAEQLAAILADEEGANFQFDDSGFRWRDFAANLAQIKQARQTLFISYGSCSFDEPREDLAALLTK
jgi:hypothetical protein